MTRTPSASEVGVLRISPDGGIYWYSTDLNYKLSTEEYTTVELRMNADARTLEICANGTSLRTVNVTTVTPGYDRCILTAARLLHNAPALEGMLYLDDIAFYYVDERIDLHKQLNAAGVDSTDIIAVTELNGWRKFRRYKHACILQDKRNA